MCQRSKLFFFFSFAFRIGKFANRILRIAWNLNQQRWMNWTSCLPSTCRYQRNTWAISFLFLPIKTDILRSLVCSSMRISGASNLFATIGVLSLNAIIDWHLNCDATYYTRITNIFYSAATCHCRRYQQTSFHIWRSLVYSFEYTSLLSLASIAFVASSVDKHESIFDTNKWIHEFEANKVSSIEPIVSCNCVDLLAAIIQFEVIFSCDFIFWFFDFSIFLSWNLRKVSDSNEEVKRRSIEITKSFHVFFLGFLSPLVLVFRLWVS